jgi:hypothetical protein
MLDFFVKNISVFQTNNEYTSVPGLRVFHESSPFTTSRGLAPCTPITGLTGLLKRKGAALALTA